MDVNALFLLLAVAALVVLFVSWPLTRGWKIRSPKGQEVSTLLAERDRLLNEIRELDFDNSLGKIPPEDYPIQRKALLQKGAEVLQKLDALGAEQKPARRRKSVPAKADAAAAPQSKAAANGNLSDEDLEILIARRRTERKSHSVGFCPRCGKPVLESDQFCACCGEPIEAHSRAGAS